MNIAIERAVNENNTLLDKNKNMAVDLMGIGVNFFNIALHRALNGKWREWNKSMPIGTTFEFNDEMLLKTGDPHIAHLIELSKSLRDTAKSVEGLLTEAYLSMPVITEKLSKDFYVKIKNIVDDLLKAKKPKVVLITATDVKLKAAISEIVGYLGPKNISCLLFSLATSKGEMIQHFLAKLAKVDVMDVRRGSLNPQKMKQLKLVAGKLSKYPIFIDDSPVVLPKEMLKKIKRLKIKNKELVIIDNLRLVVGGNGVSKTINELKNVAKNANTSIMAFCSNTSKHHEEFKIADCLIEL